jgi:WD40 repeat protein
VCDKLFLSETYPSSIVSASVDSLVHLYPSSERLSRRSAQRCISNLSAAHYCSCYDILKDNYFKVCDSRILTLAVHPTAMLAACGDKRGNIGLLRGLDEQKPESCMGTTWDRAHGAGVTGMEWKHDSNMFTRNLVSCSSDGRLLDCDVENQHSTLLFADHGSEFSALGRSASSDFFVVGNRTGCIAGLDVDRTPGPVWAIESEYRRVSSISFHPVLENIFAVSSERFIRVWYVSWTFYLWSCVMFVAMNVLLIFSRGP